MRTLTALKPMGGFKLLVAVAIKKGLQSELGDQTSARFLTFGGKGESQVHAVALGSETELQELDVKLKTGRVPGLDPYKLVFKSVSRLKVFPTPEGTARSLVLKSLKEFLDEEAVESELRKQFWIDAFGEIESETVGETESETIGEIESETIGETESETIGEDTGDSELQVFMRKLQKAELAELLPKVQQDWWESMERSAVSSWAEWLGLETLREAFFNSCSMRTVVGVAFLAAAGYYILYLPCLSNGTERTMSDVESTMTSSNDTTMSPYSFCGEVAGTEKALCIEDQPLCVLHIEEGNRCVAVRFDNGDDHMTLKDMDEIFRWRKGFSVCRLSGRCTTPFRKVKTMKALPPTQTPLIPFLPCVDETGLENKICVEGHPICVTDPSDPEKRCLRITVPLTIDDIKSIIMDGWKICEMDQTCNVKTYRDEGG
ncbi:hypothetical protein GNI_161490 [Gregarina niphandrodes]|uniref:Uncharacterized protein n=1 Tax=Gregarina niphandrodes TaxID=110365 RepID=A0A023AZH0_GRENI|nr:hypothetical protein GNI_161490 [Gregarina niphandrodes]EZG43705.1 hypothetical protein GNI_161490 [Gregarina niphandrodes]|eukprot:XP_011133062.1 hypothetical protein GNI_161490 [Gregarina niphandrodes]